MKKLIYILIILLSLANLPVYAGLQSGAITSTGTITAATFVGGGATFTGKVGIGTTSPDAKLSIEEAGIADLSLNNTSGLAMSLATGVTSSVFAYDSNGVFAIQARTKAQILSGTYDAAYNKLIVNGAGNVGIGTSSPEYKLHLSGGDFRSEGTFRTGGNEEPGRWRFYDSSGYLMSFWTTGTDYDTWGLYWDTSSNEMRWMGNGNLRASVDLDNGSGYFQGNVGIGTTSPSYKLDVLGQGRFTYSGAAGLILRRSDASSGPSELYFDRTDYLSTQKAAVGMDSSTSRDFFIWVNGVDRLNITESGNVGIGTTSPTVKLEVVGRIKDQTGFVMPVGSIIPYGGTAAPTGWLLCDGSAVSRTTYADLHTAIGTAYGYGDNSTTFNVPDLRGMFLRGATNDASKDPDYSSRTALKTGGNTGSSVGSYEADQFVSHSHTTSSSYAYTYSSPGNGIKDWDGGGSYRLSSSNVINATGGNETRPKNVYVNYIIKY